MIEPPLPLNETHRLAVLHSLHILDTPPEERFDRITRLATHFLDVPIALVSLMDADRQWFKSCIGLDLQETPRGLSFCTHTLGDNQILIVEDATKDERFYDNPFVTGEPYVRFYAGQPLMHPSGLQLGVLCVIDSHPRQFSEAQKQILRDLAAIVENQLTSVELAKSMKEREEAETEIRFQANLLDVVQQSVIATDPKGKIIYWNHFAEKLYGWPKGEVIGKNILDVLPLQSEREAGAKVLEETAKVTKSTPLEFILQHRDGRTFPVEVTSTPIFDKDKKLVGIVGISAEITERKQFEQKLLESEQRFRALIENSADMITVVDVEGRVKYQSPSVERVMGYSAEDWANGKHSFAEVHPDDRELLVHCLNELMQKDSSTARVTFRYRHKLTDNWHYLEATWQNLLSLPAIQGFVVNARDITDRYASEAELRKREEELRQAQKMEAVGRLAGGIAHDFNNLLTAILGYSDLVLLSLEEDNPLRDDVGEIRAATERAATLTRQLLAFSRKQVLQPQLLDLNVVLADIQKLLLRLIGEDIQLISVPTTSPLMVNADPNKLEQVIVNLAVNSRDAMPNGGKLVLSLCTTNLDEDIAKLHPDLKSGEYAVLSIADSGYGMDDDVKSHLFEPFFTTKELGRGTGLGLSTVYGIVKQSGGHIEVESQLGVGTTFNIYLPLASSDESAKIAETKRINTAEPLVVGTETVLLVEDEESLRNLINKALSAYGFKVVEAANAGEALLLFEEAKKSGSIDILVTDVVLPRMSGRNLVQRLASLDVNLKVLFISGYNDEINRYDDMMNGRTGFLQKPFTPLELVRKVREVLDNN